MGLTVTMAETASLVPYAGNAKEHPAEQVEQIAASIDQFGFNDPVGIWHDPDGRPIIVEGHGRVLAAQQLGIKALPVVTLDHLDDEGRRAYTLAHNQTTLTSGFDPETLAAELEAIETIDMADFGFDVPQVLEDLDAVEEDDPPKPEDVEERAQAGDLWRMGDHLLLCGDATDRDAVGRLMGGAFADLLLTDPPYNVDYASKNEALCLVDEMNRIQEDILGDNYARPEEFTAFIAQALGVGAERLKAGGAFYVWFAAWRTRELFDACDRAGLEVKQNLYWVKQHFVLGRQDYQWRTEPCMYGWKGGAGHWFAPTRCETNVIEDRADIKKMSKGELVAMVETLLNGGTETDAIYENKPLVNATHPTMKPVGLFARLIRNSTRAGETVLDPFAGSGTTAISCEQLGRRARLMELSPHYCDVILARWEKFAGRAAERVG